MKLLFDKNLSEKLCGLLEDIFPDSEHIRRAGFQGASDSTIWEFANSSQYAIVSKDSDFMDTAIFAENPTKVIWIRLGNCSTANVHLLLRNKEGAIEEFLRSDDTVFELP